MPVTLLAATALGLTYVRSADAGPPIEPLRIGSQPQFVFDNHVIDNHWAIKYKREAVKRVFHAGQKHAANPIIRGDQPSFLWVVRDEPAGMFRMWYQANIQVANDKQQGRKYSTHIAYAESKDGMAWKLPELNLFKSHGKQPNNIVLGRPDKPYSESCGPCILELPNKDKNGYRYIMLYRNKGRGCSDVNGIRIIGSNDGIHWDPKSDTLISHLHSDHHNTVSFDPVRNEYVMFCRAKHIYRTFKGPVLDTGASRRVARMSVQNLRTEWLDHHQPQTILVPNEHDNETHFNFFYGMPTRYYAGIYWGFLEPFRMNDFIYTELAVSRDGIHFDRHPNRPKLIEYGDEGAWDDEMIFASPAWVEVGDEWWVYYSGWDGPHGTTKRTGAIGLAKFRKESFISMRGPKSGGVLCTRRLVWPGGNLLVNCDASQGALRIRVTDERRKPLDGFNYDDGKTFSESSVAHEVSWGKHSMAELKGKVIRIEFYLQNADLFTFRNLR